MFGLIHECKAREFFRASHPCGRNYDPAKPAFGAAGSKSQVKVSGSMLGSHAVQATVASDGGDVFAMDSAVYFVPSLQSPHLTPALSPPVGSGEGEDGRLDLAASEGNGRRGSAGISHGPGREAPGGCGHTESSVLFWLKVES